jgi:glycerophosphoryl diester phosphodiesterase
VPDAAPRCRRVGHRGADLIAPGNSAASFDAAVAAGVDMIEFDVLPEDHRARATSPLRVAHDYRSDILAQPTFEEGLAHLSGSSFDGVELDVDMKLPGYEDRVVEALRRHELVDRSMITSSYRSSLVRVRELEPSLRLGWSVPKVRRDYTRSPLLIVPALGVLSAWRLTLPRKAAEMIRSRSADAVMVYFRLMSRSLVEAVREAGGDLYVWTVDDPERIRAYEAMGVTGVITNDPRLFGSG